MLVTPYGASGIQGPAVSPRDALLELMDEIDLNGRLGSFRQLFDIMFKKMEILSFSLKQQKSRHVGSYSLILRNSYEGTKNLQNGSGQFRIVFPKEISFEVNTQQQLIIFNSSAGGNKEETQPYEERNIHQGHKEVATKFLWAQIGVDEQRGDYLFTFDRDFRQVNLGALTEPRRLNFAQMIADWYEFDMTEIVPRKKPTGCGCVLV